MEQTCTSCDHTLPSDARVCVCGRPTTLASFKERAEYEVKEWRAYRTRKG